MQQGARRSIEPFSSALACHAQVRDRNLGATVGGPSTFPTPCARATLSSVVIGAGQQFSCILAAIARDVS